ncbi:MAG: V-type ATP synthase subunit A [Candidatus Omnitrophica bacterium]|nr:V-type ATP synthase subunit A [Candidatus Omnitrophota bacterium]MCG2703665.1 V-type ATP synthase subunit A [Candidatus Omnitrophota bacterium]
MSTKGRIIGVVSNLVTIEVDGPVSQNEICYIILDKVRLKAEVIKIQASRVFAQVFESTRGLKTGTDVEFTERLLEVTLGPGLLSKKYDGLQSDLEAMSGVFLQRGEQTEAFSFEAKWEFNPLMEKGVRVQAGDWLGEVKENWISHKIMVPFSLPGVWEVVSVCAKGKYTVNEIIAVLKNAQGQRQEVTMVQYWPVKIPIRAYAHKPVAFKLLQTGVRLIDTINPIVEGGTGFIPGPFGCGKTVLQHIIAANAQVDMVIICACGERANEVVEIFKEYPELDDPFTGRKLMERTIIICNTSNMPVAAREASVYTAMTIAEYYRQMGLKILLLADSTSRWAQALREMSNRMEELPGPDAFPMDLPAVVANFYSRAGLVELSNGQSGSITFIGTVSPAGGNMKEPVTESTKKVARCFYALSQKRADGKRYPSIDTIESYSKYLEYKEVQEYLEENMEPHWVEKVVYIKDVLLRGKEAYDQINILGDDSVPVSYHERYWKSELVDFCFLQQDAFDDIDKATPIDRQKYMIDIIYRICKTDFKFEAFSEVVLYFKRLIHLLRQMNYSQFQQEEFKKYEDELQSVVTERKVS